MWKSISTFFSIFSPLLSVINNNFILEKVLNEHRIRNVEEAKIVLNAYRLDVSQAVEKVYKYELKFMGRIPPDTEKDLSRGQRNE